MLTVLINTLIKAYCINIMVDIKATYLNKRYLFQNKIYYLDNICKNKALQTYSV